MMDLQHGLAQIMHVFFFPYGEVNMMHTLFCNRNPIVPYFRAFVGTMFIIGEFVKRELLESSVLCLRC